LGGWIQNQISQYDYRWSQRVKSEIHFPYHQRTTLQVFLSWFILIFWTFLERTRHFQIATKICLSKLAEVFARQFQYLKPLLILSCINLWFVLTSKELHLCITAQFTLAQICLIKSSFSNSQFSNFALLF